MYLNLLATAMDKDTVERAHPAFAEVIRQLTPDEARILPVLVAERTIPQVTPGTVAPQVHPFVRFEFTQPLISLVHLDAKCDYPALIPSYLDNLRRLGIISLGDHSNSFRADPDPRFQRLLDHPLTQDLIRKLEESHTDYQIYGGKFGLTTFGSQFCDACVVEHRVGT